MTNCRLRNLLQFSSVRYKFIRQFNLWRTTILNVRPPLRRGLCVVLIWALSSVVAVVDQGNVISDKHIIFSVVGQKDTRDIDGYTLLLLLMSSAVDDVTAAVDYYYYY